MAAILPRRQCVNHPFLGIPYFLLFNYNHVELKLRDKAYAQSFAYNNICRKKSIINWYDIKCYN